MVFPPKRNVKAKEREQKKKDPQKIKQFKALKNNNLSIVIVYLIAILSKNEKRYIIYLDNLFTNIKLLIYRRKKGQEVIKTYTKKSGIIKKFSKIKI